MEGAVLNKWCNAVIVSFRKVYKEKERLKREMYTMGTKKSTQFIIFIILKLEELLRYKSHCREEVNNTMVLTYDPSATEETLSCY